MYVRVCVRGTCVNVRPWVGIGCLTLSLSILFFVKVSRYLKLTDLLDWLASKSQGVVLGLLGLQVCNTRPSSFT